jgi:surfeit locus 1 family protein
MLRRLKDAGLLGATLAMLVGLALLIALGTWQMQRKQWKEGLIARIAERVTAGPIDLAQAEDIWRRTGDIEYLHVTAHGRFQHDKERYLFAPTQEGGPGWHVYTPLEVAQGRILWVNRGWVPDAAKAAPAHSQGQLPGEVEIRGLLRMPEKPGAFTPANDVARNQWFWRDVAGMTASAFAGGSVEALPFELDADALPEPPGGLPRGGVTRIELPNRHLEYAITWYGLALTLIGVYSAFVATRLGLMPGGR